ncbi:MAG: glycosyltransferase family 9 protein [Spirochaetes bacterium]|nr:glycosyltransferase family 9 protein [Spirochaetota bacterium]
MQIFLLIYYFRKLFYTLRFYIGNFFIHVDHGTKIDPGSVKRILIFRTDRIGDLVLTTPAISNLRKFFKKAVIDIVVNSYIRPVIENNKDIDHIILKDQYKEPALVKILKKNKYDLAVIFHSIIEDKRIAFKAGIPVRIGSNRDGGAFYLTHYIPDTRDDLRHEVQACNDILKILRIPLKENQLKIYPDKKYKTKIERIAGQLGVRRSGKTVMIHPFSRDRKMRWTEEHYARLTQMLMDQKKYRVVIIGSKSEISEAEEFVKKITPTPVNAAGIFSLAELISFIGYADLFIGNSTGTMHIANALKVPVIAMYGSRYIRHHYKRWYPWNKGAYFFIGDDSKCRVCFPWACNLECMRSVTPEKVFKQALKMLK